MTDQGDDRDVKDEAESAPGAGERLQRVLANRGVASRRASETLIAEGHVSVNGKVVTQLGTRVDALHDVIRVDGKQVPRQKPRFLMLNKPTGFITTVSDERQRWTVMDLIKVQERVYPVGRLDRDTQGLLLFTNDGAVANRVMHPRYGLTKEYHVITDKRPADHQMADLREGILVDGHVVVPDECRLLRETREGIIIKLVLHEGLYHVVRVMMERVGIHVVTLRRVRLGPLMLAGIPQGAWRDLTPGELGQLYEALGLPPEDAEQANARRTMQLEPVGGFVHGSGTADAGDSRPPAGSAPPRGAASRPPTTGQHRSRPISTRPGRPNDTSRPSPGHRDRRPRRGR